MPILPDQRRTDRSPRWLLPAGAALLFLLAAAVTVPMLQPLEFRVGAHRVGVHSGCDRLSTEGAPPGLYRMGDSNGGTCQVILGDWFYALSWGRD